MDGFLGHGIHGGQGGGLVLVGTAEDFLAGIFGKGAEAAEEIGGNGIRGDADTFEDDSGERVLLDIPGAGFAKGLGEKGLHGDEALLGAGEGEGELGSEADGACLL